MKTIDSNHEEWKQIPQSRSLYFCFKTTHQFEIKFYCTTTSEKIYKYSILRYSSEMLMKAFLEDYVKLLKI